MTPISPPPRARERFAAIDGLRGLACLAVVSHHAYYNAGRYQWPGSLPRFLSYGYLGVEIFFVLSGFCLAYPLLAAKSATTSWWIYAQRRILRIVPAYWAALALLLIMSLILARWNVGSSLGIRFLQVPTVRQFFYAVSLVGVWFNPVFWTLTVEARWYLLLPFAITLTRRCGVLVLFIICVAVSAAYAFVEPLQSGRLEFLIGPLPLFLPLFAIGIAAAAVLRRNRFSLGRRFVLANRLCVLLSVSAVAWFTPVHPQDGFHYSRIVPGGLVAGTLLAAALWDPEAKRLLSSRFLTITGIVSYSLYLIHLPIIQFSYAFTSGMQLREWQQLLLYQGVIVPSCIAAAGVFYICFERPFLRYAHSRRTAVLASEASSNVAGVRQPEASLSKL